MYIYSTATDDDALMMPLNSFRLARHWKECRTHRESSSHYKLVDDIASIDDATVSSQQQRFGPKWDDFCSLPIIRNWTVFLIALQPQAMNDELWVTHSIRWITLLLLLSYYRVSTSGFTLGLFESSKLHFKVLWLDDVNSHICRTT